jgi:hypothetical protein
LAFYGGRVRSNEVLERARHSLTKLIEPLATTLSGVCPTSATPDRRALAEAGTQDAADHPAAQHRLPYPPDFTNRPARPRARGPGTETLTGLAIDLGGSLDLGFRPGDTGAAYLDRPRACVRRVNEE